MHIPLGEDEKNITHLLLCYCGGVEWGKVAFTPSIGIDPKKAELYS